MLRTPAAIRDLPAGPPLYLERPGRPRELLGPFLLPERVDRMRRALDARTAHVTAVLEHLHDPHNIGACIRTLDALGIHDIHIIRQPEAPTPERPYPDRLKLGRDVTRGSEKWLDVHVSDVTATALHDLKTAGVAIAVTDIHGASPAYTPLDVPLDRPLAVVFGNEHDGITAAAREMADYRLILPMHGFVESLNVSVALALIMGRLRERVDTELPPEIRALPTHRREAILDRWICNDIPNLRVVVRELQTRLTGG